MSTMDSEQFFLKWNNFESNLASGFSDLLESEAMVDVTLAAEGRIVQAHKIILSVCSSYFKNMFQVNPCQHPIVFLKDVRYQELTDMLDFMYKGEANVKQEDLPAFLKLAETLEVKGLAGTSDLEENSKERKEEEEEKLVNTHNSNLVRNSCPSSYISRENFVEKMPFVPKKKPKRCSSPISYSESGSLVQSPVIKLERECESSGCSVEDSSTNNEICVVKEERFSDNSSDYYVENVDDCLEKEKKAGPSSAEDNPDATAPGKSRVTKNYEFVESGSGGVFLVLDGFSYRRKSKGPEKSYWFCRRPKCPAKGVLESDGQFRVTELRHSHAREQDAIARKQNLVKLKKLAVKMNVPGQELLRMLDIKGEVKKNLNYIRSCRKREREKKNQEQQRYRWNKKKQPVTVKVDHDQYPSLSMGILRHSGYEFRHDSENTKTKCKYWRCKVKTCKARAKTDLGGNLTILQPVHNHQVTQGLEQVQNKAVFNIRGVNSPGKIDRGSLASKSEMASCVSLSFGSSVPETETFNLEKLMADTLADYEPSLGLLKNH